MPVIGVQRQLLRPSCLRGVTGFVPGAHEDVLIEPLTAREQEVLALICDGQSNQGIARRLGIRLATVKFHLNQIFGKLGVQRRTQAVAVAVFLGIVRPDWLPPRAPGPAAEGGAI